ncbi:hypothetical protein HG530_002254 [Fusarium avenaceum]|nr:hypothetical protein HG530_002254 [Fusarium avenaceum]
MGKPVILLNTLCGCLWLGLRGLSLVTWPLRPAQLDDIASLDNPVLAWGFALVRQLRSSHGRLCDNVRILANAITYGGTKTSKTIDCSLSNNLGHTARLSLTQDQAGLKNHGLLKVQILDRILDSILHFRIR